MLNLRDGKILVERYNRFSAIDDKGQVSFDIPTTSDVDWPFQLTNGNIIIFGHREYNFPLYSEKGGFLGEINLGIDFDVGLVYLGFDRFISRDSGQVFTINGILRRLDNSEIYNYLGLADKGIVALGENKIIIYSKDLTKLYELKSILKPSYPKSAIQNGDYIIVLRDEYLEVWSLKQKRMISYIDVDEAQYMILLKNGKIFVQEFETQLVYDIQKNEFNKARDQHANSRVGIQLLDGRIATISKNLVTRDINLNILNIYNTNYPSSIAQFPSGKVLLYWISTDDTNLNNDRIEIVSIY